jgi:hypothetical protein
MLENFRAIGFLEVSDAEPPEDVESSLDVFQFGKDGVEVPAEDVRLEKLVASLRVEDEPRRARADEVAQHGCEGRAKVYFADTVFGFEVRLDPQAFFLPVSSLWPVEERKTPRTVIGRSGRWNSLG